MMSDRERWIVYPLLTLSLALGAKTHWNAFRGRSDFHMLTCRTLVIRNELDEEQIVLQQNAQGAAEVSLLGEKGIEALLTAGPGGGRLMLVRRDDQKALLLGHDKLLEFSGVWAVDADRSEAALIPLASDAVSGDGWKLLPWPISTAREQDKPDPAKASQAKKEENKQ